MEMGFTESQAKKALAEAGNVDGAVSYIFANADKPPSFWEATGAGDEPAAGDASEPAHRRAGDRF